MNFLTILIAVFFYRNWVGENPFKKIALFNQFFDWCAERNLPTNIAYLITVGTPCLVIAVIYLQFSSLFFGAFGLALAVVLVLFSVDLIDLESPFDEQNIWLRDGDKALTDVVQKQEEFEITIIYEIFQSVMPVIFWFVIMGPIGAIFYALTIRYLDLIDINDPEVELIEIIVYWLEWPVVQLSGVVFALIGNFTPTIENWLTHVVNLNDTAAERLHEMASIAIDTSDEHYADDAIGFAKLSEYRNNELRMLCDRLLYGWLGFAALFTIIGW